MIDRIQKLLREANLPAWLFYDFRGSDPIAYRVLGLDPKVHATRRWFYLIPAKGTPRKIVHRIESGRLDALPGERRIYLEWQSLDRILEEELGSFSRLAMQYSPDNSIPYLSKVDGGTLERIRRIGCEVVTSADLVQRFEAVLSPSQIAGHRRAASLLTRIVEEAFDHTARAVTDRGETTEYEIQRFILDRFEEEELETDAPPIVGVNANSGDPHYEPSAGRSSPIRQGDFLLIDLWARPKLPDGVFADITWVGYLGGQVPDRILEVFDAVRRGRDAGFALLGRRYESGEPTQGWEVDEVVRDVIKRAGFGEAFIHRTGHNLGTSTHGNGVNFDNLETHDTREFIPGLACTIEPGIYLPEFGVRSEIDVYWGDSGPEITTPPQDSVLTHAVGSK